MAQSQLTRIEREERLIETIVSAIAAALGTDYQNVVAKLDAVMAKLDQIEQELNAPSPDDVAVSASIVAVQHFDLVTGEEVKMPQNILNDVKSVLHVEFDNLAGAPVPPPATGQVAVSLVDGSGAPSPLGTAVVGSPDGSGMDGSKVTISPNTPAGSSVGDATLKYDDTINGGTPSDISFSFDLTFTADAGAASAHVDPATIETFPL